jgi:DNA-binding NarL/FixJ family response regulator
MKSIAIVEDSEDMQIIYKRVFRKETDVTIVLQVSTAEEALDTLEQVPTDLVIIDISLPGMSGIELTKELKKKYPGLKILIITGHDKDAYESICMEAGADGFMIKGDGNKMIAEVKKLLQLT